MDKRILLVEDEENILEAVKLNLEMEGYDVTGASNGIDAIKFFNSERFNLVILDIMLPDMDGYQVCEKIRLTNLEIPVLFLTAKDSSDDKITGLKLGADDYLTKPFNLEELLLRVKILIRHSLKGTEKENNNHPPVKFGSNEIDFSNYTAKGVGGKKIQLTQKETALLKILIDRKNEVVSRQHILQTVWQYDVYPNTRTIDNFVLTFRKYFKKIRKIPNISSQSEV